MARLPRALGRWTRAEWIRGGGQARVFRATDGVEGHPVRALKVVEGHAPQKRGRFVREVRVHLDLARRGAPNIVPILDHNLEGFEAGAKYGFIVMPLAEANLEGQIGLLTGRVELALEVFTGIARGVREAHRASVVHRDIKPSNVLFLDRTLREPLLTDFGIRFLKQDRRLTRAGETVGARFFMAPEQERGGVVDVDERADIYALGKLLHYMLTGRYLFREKLDEAFRQEELDGDPRYRRILDEILRRTIVEARDDRFQSVDEMIAALGMFTAGPGQGPGGPARTSTPPATDRGPSPSPIPSEDRGPGKPGDSPRDLYVEATQAINTWGPGGIKLRLDEARDALLREWEGVYGRIRDDPSRAASAAQGVIRAARPALATLLAPARLDAVDLLPDVRRLLEALLRAGDGRDGYAALHAVPHAVAGFIYMALCTCTLSWESWRFLRGLLWEKLEWSSHSGRPLYSHGFEMDQFFHSEALGRDAARIHDLYRAELDCEEFAAITGIGGDSLLGAYCQAQMLLCLRAAQEAQGDEDNYIWADFGRFNEQRVLPLLERVHSDERFAEQVGRLFGEPPKAWMEKLNARLDHIRRSYWDGGRYGWNSVERFEPRWGTQPRRFRRGGG
jgi:hypothetical protein